nr:MAG TPA: hypothetical protein [Caudoviricetes sp.]
MFVIIVIYAIRWTKVRSVQQRFFGVCYSQSPQVIKVVIFYSCF